MRRARMGCWTWIVVCSGLLAGCSTGAPTPELIGEALDPSNVVAVPLDLGRLARTDDCVSCHADVGSHWESSVHSYASFDNPWYRVSVDTFREERGHEESRFCAGCHDPLLLLSGTIDREVEPDDDLAYAGITCLVCHGAESVRTDGNGSYALGDLRVLIPDPADDEEIAQHRRDLTMAPLRRAELCGSCHRSFAGSDIGNEHHLPGIDDIGDWASSGYSGAATWHLASVEPETCQSCHMPSEPGSPGEMARNGEGTIRSHRWGASHTALAAQLDDDQLLEQARDALMGAVIIDVGAVRTGRRRTIFPRNASVRPAEKLVFDVLLQNARVGHRFPGGIRDLQDTWVEVTVRDAKGRVLARSSRDGDRPVYSLRATVLDRNAEPERLHRVHRFSTAAFDRTLGAHDARAVRYSMTLPERLAPPLRVDVELLHRKHAPDFQVLACEASRTERGLAFSRGAEARGKVAVDPCDAEPITTVGTATAWIGRGASKRTRLGGAARPDVERLLTQGLALLHGRQEYVRYSKPSIDRALELAKRSGDTMALARAWALRARLAATEGRPKDAVRFSQRAEAIIGAHPVLDRIRGDAFARVWRWKAAVEWYLRVCEATPEDPRAWRSLGRAYGSLGMNEEALRASNRGLGLLPHDEMLLRTRALSLEALGDARAADARRAWLEHRSPDVQSRRLAACEQTHEVCARDRQPIPHYTLDSDRKRFHARLDPR